MRSSPQSRHRSGPGGGRSPREGKTSSPAGALVLREVMGNFGFDQCIVSETDILDGLAMSLLEQ